MTLEPVTSPKNFTEQTKNYQGGAKQSEQSYSDVRMYETSTALDPVAAFEFYLSKTHPDCKALFQTPNKATTKNINFASTRHWYRNEPMGKGTISKMMETEDFHQSRVIGAVHESPHWCIDCHFFVPARCGRKENLCNHKAKR